MPLICCPECTPNTDTHFEMNFLDPPFPIWHIWHLLWQLFGFCIHFYILKRYYISKLININECATLPPPDSNNDESRLNSAFNLVSNFRHVALCFHSRFKMYEMSNATEKTIIIRHTPPYLYSSLTNAFEDAWGKHVVQLQTWLVWAMLPATTINF